MTQTADTNAPPVDIGILTIREDEFKAVLKCFPDEKSVYRGRHREYSLRTAEAGGGLKYRLAILRQIEQGNGEAQEAARDLIDDLQPSLLLVVGIAGGLPSDDLTLGDVVLSTRVIDFSVEARKFEESPTYNAGGGPIAKAIAAGVANLGAREEELGEWWSSLPPKPRVSPNAKGQYYGPLKWQKLVKEKLASHFRATASRPPIFMAGPIASSDRLVKDPSLLVPWISTHRHLLAIEMESAGVHRASRDRTPMLAIRAISDLVGLKRNDAWTKYACAAAAGFTLAYLRTRPVPISRVPATNTEPATQVIASVSTARADVQEAFANLLPLRHFPEQLFVAPALCRTMKQGWAVLRKARPNQFISGAWTIYENNVYSFVDPEITPIARIVDVGAIEAFDTKSWAHSADDSKRRLFAYLLNTALRDDLWAIGVRFYGDQEVFAFMGRPKEGPRTLKYANLKVRSTATVVAHYESTAKSGKKYRYLRHNAFQGRFRYLGGQWYIEITPTYRFTKDGHDLERFHEKRLSGIKRLERNRSVLSQLLIWQAMLRSPWTALDHSRSLEFAPLVTFSFDPMVNEAELTAIDPPSVPIATDVEVPQ